MIEAECLEKVNELRALHKRQDSDPEFMVQTLDKQIVAAEKMKVRNANNFAGYIKPDDRANVRHDKAKERERLIAEGLVDPYSKEGITMSFEVPPLPRGKKDMLRDLAEYKANSQIPTLYPETLQAMEQNKRDVEAGILPRYVGEGGQVDNQSEEEKLRRIRRFATQIK